VLDQQMPTPQSELTVILQEMRRMSSQSEASLQEMSEQMLQSENRQAASFAKQLLQRENRQAEMIKDIQEKLLTSIFSKVAELTVQLAKQEVSEPELNCVGRDQQQAGQHSVKASEQTVHAESVTETELDCLELEEPEVDYLERDQQQAGQHSMNSLIACSSVSDRMRCSSYCTCCSSRLRFIPSTRP